jgi:tripartite-type tricarboxylate transporter receptor subunit TctC
MLAVRSCVSPVRRSRLPLFATHGRRFIRRGRVRVIVPYAPGGPTDVFGRLIAQRLSEQLGKQFYVENVGGANGNIGMSRAAKAPPDGYTLLVVSPSFAINFTLYEKPGYDPDKDFDPVALAVSNPLVLTVNPSVPARSVAELIALIKASPGTFNYATGGTGSLPHLVGEQFRLSSGLDLVHVPFNSAGLAIGSPATRGCRSARWRRRCRTSRMASCGLWP